MIQFNPYQHAFIACNHSLTDGPNGHDRRNEISNRCIQKDWIGIMSLAVVLVGGVRTFHPVAILCRRYGRGVAVALSHG